MIKIGISKHVCSSSLWSYPDPICAYNCGKCLLTYSDKIEFLLLTPLHREYSVRREWAKYTSDKKEKCISATLEQTT